MLFVIIFLVIVYQFPLMGCCVVLEGCRFECRRGDPYRLVRFEGFEIADENQDAILILNSTESSKILSQSRTHRW